MSNVLHKNCLYFQIPEELITRRLLGNMKESELKLYLALLYQAQRYSTTTPKFAGHDLIKATGLATSSATAARKSLIEHGLIRAKRGVGNAYAYQLLNPITGHPMTNYLKAGASQARGDGLSHLARRLYNLPKEEYERYYRKRLEGAEIISTSNGLSSHCPFHDDRTPSLEIGLSRGVWYCHPCAEGGGMVEFERRLKNCDASSALQSVASLLGFGPRESTDEGAIAAYDYPDETGELLFQVVRFPDKDGKKQIRVRSPDFDNDREWRWDTEGVRRVLYRLPEVLNASRVIVTEGEKDADTVCNMLRDNVPDVVIGTTNPFGAGNWKPEFSESLRAKDVVILPDNDERGEQHAQSVMESISGVVRSVKRVNIPIEEGVKDVSDFIQKHSPAELIDLIGLDWFGYAAA